MVVAVEVQSGPADSSFVSIRVETPGDNRRQHHDDHFLVDYRGDDNHLDGSFASAAARDTSHTSRGPLENSRVSVNTHISILNITDEDEEDEDHEYMMENRDRSFLFEEEMVSTSVLDQSLTEPAASATLSTPNPKPSIAMAPPTPPMRKVSCCDPLGGPNTPDVNTEVATTRMSDSSFLDMTERFVESLCVGDKSELAAGPVEKKPTATELSYRRVLEVDIFELLGCVNSPDEEEMEQVWHLKQAAFCTLSGSDSPQRSSCKSPRQRPRRKSLRERAVGLRRLRVERALPQKRTGLSPTTVIPTHRSRSLNDDPRRQLFEQELGDLKIDPILPNAGVNHDDSLLDNGYDSDPGECFLEPHSGPVAFPSDTSVANNFESPRKSESGKPGRDVLPFAERDIRQGVQETLNLTWTLTWHPSVGDMESSTASSPSTISPSSGSAGQPHCCSVWIERGTLVDNNTVMLEPNLMWRQAYQPHLHKNKLNKTSQKPFSLRLLNLCRILEDYDRSKYPLARPSCSFLVKTADVGDILFEAGSPEERSDIVRRWKLTVARFATLAIMEDLETICAEFFAPVSRSNMLVPDYEYDVPREKNRRSTNRRI